MNLLKKWICQPQLNRIDQLQKELATTEAQREFLQGRNIEMRGEIATLREERDAAIASERKLHMYLHNVKAQMETGHVPFPEAPHIPPDRVRQPETGSLGETSSAARLVRAITEENAAAARKAWLEDEIEEAAS